MLQLGKVDIQTIREELYLGQGYVVIRGAVSVEIIDHLQRFWNKSKKLSFKKTFNKYIDIQLNGPDCSMKNEQKNTHYNLFWNQPRDIATYNLAWQLQAFRNQIEGQPTDWGYFPNYYTPGENKSLRYVSSYRVVFTHESNPVPMHSDWDLDHSKIQVSLMLTSYDKDYKEGGMLINDRFRGGEPLNISQKENLQAGDLLLFRYAHTHGVAAVQSTSNGKGFGRMLMPVEVVDLREQSFWFKQKKNWMILGLKIQAKVNRKRPQFQKLLSSKKRLVRGQGEDLYYNEEVLEMMNIAIRQGLSPAHVYLYRGLWGRFKMFQDWQLAVLHKHGLQPHHHFLDIGCGMLRLGMKLIPFLDSDKYCGIDPIDDYIQVGKLYLQKLTKTEKKYQLLIDRNFNFQKFDRSFDFAMAQSVFTHLSFVQIEECFVALKKAMKPGGKFLFTIILGKDKEQEILYIDNRPLTKSSHSNLAFYDQLAHKMKFELKYLEKEKHPTQQVCLAVF